MIKLEECTDKCFALVFNQCTILKETNCDKCVFYKPNNCEDWMRIDTANGTILYTPEEYEIRRKCYE